MPRASQRGLPAAAPRGAGGGGGGSGGSDPPAAEEEGLAPSSANFAPELVWERAHITVKVAGRSFGHEQRARSGAASLPHPRKRGTHLAIRASAQHLWTWNGSQSARLSGGGNARSSLIAALFSPPRSGARAPSGGGVAVGLRAAPGRILHLQSTLSLRAVRLLLPAPVNIPSLMHEPAAHASPARAAAAAAMPAGLHSLPGAALGVDLPRSGCAGVRAAPRPRPGAEWQAAGSQPCLRAPRAKCGASRIGRWPQGEGPPRSRAFWALGALTAALQPPCRSVRVWPTASS